MAEIPFFWYVVPVAAIIALVAAYLFFRSMIRMPEGTPRMREIAQYVREGAFAYLARQYKTVSVVFAILFLVFVLLAFLGIQNPFVPIAFLTGGFFSGLCGEFVATIHLYIIISELHLKFSHSRLMLKFLSSFYIIIIT